LLPALRRYAVSRSLFEAASLQQALDTFGFVQADPIRAPARAQDLTLRHRVPGYRAGDLERQYPDLRIEEDFFVNYGFVTPALHALMHPRTGKAWPKARRARADNILAFVRERGAAHPREVEAHFAHGRVTNYWGGSSNATTHLLDLMHYRSLLRVVRRDSGVRVYGVRDRSRDGGDLAPDARLDALIDAAVHIYAPVPAATLSWLALRLRYGAPQFQTRTRRALERAKKRLAHARIGAADWYWPADEAPEGDEPASTVRLLAPFDPIVWDRRRFELFWEWAYRFEAYTPVAKRKLGYYALPLLWRDAVIGWANVSAPGGALRVEAGYVSGRAPRDRGFRQAFDEEIERLRGFLGGSGR
jgi:uncharacterized protein YcaQ